MTQIFHIAPTTVRWVWLAIPAVLVLVALTVAMAILLKSMSGARSSTFEVSPEGLRIRGDIYGRLIPTGQLVADSARRVDISTGDFRPVLRVGGTAVPGYRSGWFRLANGSRALLYVTDPAKVVLVPTRDDYSLLLSVTETDRFVAQVRALGR
ncbi:MAG TPA: PH domain-containing protein [Gemmatimonadaceae bacterium]|jgi:hypothetical protein